MPIYKVSAEALYEFTIEAEDDELAIEEAVELFDESWDGNVFSLFKWKATEIEITIRGGDLNERDRADHQGDSATSELVS